MNLIDNLHIDIQNIIYRYTFDPPPNPPPVPKECILRYMIPSIMLDNEVFRSTRCDNLANSRSTIEYKSSCNLRYYNESDTIVLYGYCDSCQNQIIQQIKSTHCKYQCTQKLFAFVTTKKIKLIESIKKNDEIVYERDANFELFLQTLFVGFVCVTLGFLE